MLSKLKSLFYSEFEFQGNSRPKETGLYQVILDTHQLLIIQFNTETDQWYDTHSREKVGYKLQIKYPDFEPRKIIEINPLNHSYHFERN
jgi:hypothetical protein